MIMRSHNLIFISFSVLACSGEIIDSTEYLPNTGGNNVGETNFAGEAGETGSLEGLAGEAGNSINFGGEAGESNTDTGGVNTGGQVSVVTGGLFAGGNQNTGGNHTGGDNIEGGSLYITGGAITGGIIETGGTLTGGTSDNGGSAGTIIPTSICGDGQLGETEECEDNDTNPTGGDGCSATCTIETGWICPTLMEPCRPICGDVLLYGNEECEDGNIINGDGCNTECQIEIGYDCPNVGKACILAVCGNGVPEHGESCDDGNLTPFDGCSSVCNVEPICNSGVCISICGDGLLFSDEECDDANTVGGDGCSDTCKIELGYKCNQPTLGNSISVPVVYRDFKENHADFEPGVTGCDEPSLGMVVNTLDIDGKPILGDGYRPSPGCEYILDKNTFAEWYRDVPGINYSFATTMTLWDNGNGGYVNRYTEDGGAYIASVDTGSEQGDYGTDLASCQATCTTRTSDNLQCENVCAPESDLLYDLGLELQTEKDSLEPDEQRIIELENILAEQETIVINCFTNCNSDFTIREANCQSQCLPCSFNAEEWCIGGELVEYDGNPTFFPVDHSTFDTTRSTASIPDAYGGTWQDDPTGIEHNFWFTSEVRFWFTYDSNIEQLLKFTGDDDLWVFINNHLAVDLGGMHLPLNGSVNVNNVAAQLGLNDGDTYEIAVFHAERQTTGSSYKLTLSGFNVASSECELN